MSNHRVIIFDTTLRDGEQSPGMSMTKEEKLLVAEVLDGMGVDVIEAGFAMSSQGDFDAIHAIAQTCKQATVCSLARARPADIERAAEAIKPAARQRIHSFMSTSDIHLKYQFKLNKEEVLEIIGDTVTLARGYCEDIEWSAMDATRSDLDFLCRAVEMAISSGATTINLPDTVGYGTPEDIATMFTQVMERVPNADQAVFSFHGQNDLGLATANTLAALRAGARQAELTINGIGERAGNTALEEVVMALKTRQDTYGLHCNVVSEHLMRASRLIQSVTGQPVQVNKAIVGANAFAHESGIHQDGMLKHSGTYEIMTPASVGLDRSNMVMGKHSGRHAFQTKLGELGITLGDNAFQDAFDRFKVLADKKKSVYDADILALVDDSERDEEALRLESLQVHCGTEAHTAYLTLTVEGQSLSVEQEGNGPVDAIFKGIKALVPGAERAHLNLYQVHAITAGTDAQAEVTVRLELDHTIINGHGADVDTLVASAKAYLDALRKVELIRNRHRELLDLEEV